MAYALEKVGGCQIIRKNLSNKSTLAQKKSYNKNEERLKIKFNSSSM